MYNACMVALQIRGVPDDVRDLLSARAAARGQSLQAFLLSLVTEEARRSSNLAVLSRFVGRRDGSRLGPDDVTQELDRARSERESRLTEAPGDTQ